MFRTSGMNILDWCHMSHCHLKKSPGRRLGSLRVQLAIPLTNHRELTINGASFLSSSLLRMSLSTIILMMYLARIRERQVYCPVPTASRSYYHPRHVYLQYAAFSSFYAQASVDCSPIKSIVCPLGQTPHFA